MKQRLAVIALAVAVSGTAPAQSTQFQQVFTSDTIIPSVAQTSPDGKWIVMSRPEGGSAASLWIVPLSGGAPIRLTSSSHNDRQPAWFSNSNRIVFHSTRPNRNGGQQQFLMTLEINPATGRAIGAPRQVTSEPVAPHARGVPSPDGRLILYITSGQPHSLLRIVPSNGGTARTVAEGPMLPGSLAFSRDSKDVYYTQTASVAGSMCRPNGVGCTSFTIKRVAIGGGTPATVATESYKIRALLGDPRYVIHQVDAVSANINGGIWELRDSTGRSLGSLDVDDRMSTLGPTGDGWGIVRINRVEERSSRVVAVPNGKMRVVTSGDRRWPEAWMENGSAIITDRAENGRIVVEVTSLDGKALATHTLPTDAERSGWSSSVGPWFSYQTGRTGLSALNVATGATKRISNSAIRSINGRGGMDQDATRWTYIEENGNQQSIKSTDIVTGATSQIRTFTGGASQRRYYQIHGSRLAWLEARGDSIDLMVSENESATPRRVLSALGTLDGADESLAWNWKGDRIAVCGGASGVDRSLTILTVPDGSAPVSRQELDLGNDVGCWAPQWLPDDSGIAYLTIPDRRRADVPDLAFLSLQPGAQPKVLTADDAHEVWSFILSPDGRQAVYPVNLPVSRASIHVASFKALVEGRR